MTVNSTAQKWPIDTPWSRVLILEGPAGPSGCGRTENYLAANPELTDGRTFVVSCDFDRGGLWAGVNTIFSNLLPEISRGRPDLMEKHAYELVLVVPHLRRSLVVRNPALTDLAPEDEKVRNYAADRAFRIVHGLIDLLDEWKSATCPGVRWLIACDNYGSASSIAGRFFRELMRRRGQKLGIRLVLGVEFDKSNEIRDSFSIHTPVDVLSGDFVGCSANSMSAEIAAEMAGNLEAEVGDDRIEMQIKLPDLVRLWQLAGRADKVVKWRYFGLAFYCNLGFYEDALLYGEGLLALAAEHLPDDHRLQSWILIKTLHGYIGAKRIKSAMDLALGDGMKFSDRCSTVWRSQLFYLTGVLHARHAQPRDFAKGEYYLDCGLKIIQEGDLTESERHFQSVFNRNGVAMIRSFQGRFEEAAELCLNGFANLNAHLDPGKHRLHRSVLLYNISQVHIATGAYTEAIKYYSAAMTMDPNYSEYYNERGNLFLRLGRLKEAISDYLQAIEFSPPYFEVFANLGQCYRQMGAMEQAVDSYSRALDLDPDQVLPLLGRAKAHEELGNIKAAIADYTAALSRDPGQWEALASRGVMFYEEKNLTASLADFDLALKLKPDQCDLYNNRSLVLADLGRGIEAARDIETALRLNPANADKTILEARLAELGPFADEHMGAERVSPGN